MRGATRTGIVALACLPAAAAAQRAVLTVEPRVGWAAASRFYDGPIASEESGIIRREGTITMESGPTWGLRVAVRPTASRWSLGLQATTAETYSVLQASASSDGLLLPYRLRTPARLTTLALDVARELRTAPTSRLGLAGRVGAAIASATFEPRRYTFGLEGPPTPDWFTLQARKPWNRRYVSPGADAGLDASWRLRGALALVASGAVAVVRNETSAMATAGRGITLAPIEPKDRDWMTVPRFTVGIAMRR